MRHVAATALIAGTALLLPACASGWLQQTPEASAADSVRGHPRYTLLGSYCPGDMEHETAGIGEAKADAEMWRARGEIRLTEGFGFGVNVERYKPGQMYDGRGDLEIRDIGIYAFAAVGDGERFRLPVRFGVFTNHIDLNRAFGRYVSGVDWKTVGARISIEPELVLLSSRMFEWSVYAGVSGAIGRTEIELTQGEEQGSATANHYGFEAGVRAQIGPALVGVSWASRWLEVGSGSGGYYYTPDVKETDNSFEGVLFSAGFRI